ncbi:tau-cadinol synthase-like [Panicum virgatum]|uniref:Uncharacterized protein n=1 Tax=Panicum virgatum TaxID=38727 RepID=A0A8T0PB42_PANVG|nr:tau-cadinol synthase-like [Panicum virgatum]KAG2558178.1 hypothetical protein PVAP13_8NG101200 [Panicum virgatum]
MRERANKLKEEVGVLFQNCKNIVEKMNLVDVLQRLGIDHHFEEQITTTLHSIHNADFNSGSLNEVSLRFRLLRQQGFWVPPDVFNIFKSGDGSFVSDITNDTKGLLGLYNAAHLLTHNEGALEEAILFARHHLELERSTLKSPFAEQVTRALRIPLPRTLKRVEALNYITEYNVYEQPYNPAILELAKLEFNLLQHLYLKELKTVSQWWKDLSAYIELDYIRDRLIEGYFYSYNVYHEQEHARARIILTKIFVLWTLLDDTFDTHANLEECQKLHQAIERWDESAACLLPDYLTKFFLKLISNFREFDNELGPHEKYRSAYNKKAFQKLSSYYLQESEWFHKNHIPSFKDQMDVSVMTGGAQMACVGILFGMDDVAPDAFEWAIGCSDSAKTVGAITRYANDLAAFKNGGNKMDTANSVECYIKEHNVTSEVALAKISDLVEHEWKNTNEARFKNRELLSVVQRVSNCAMCAMFYCHGMRDLYTNSKDIIGAIESHFVNPISL